MSTNRSSVAKPMMAESLEVGTRWQVCVMNIGNCCIYEEALSVRGDGMAGIVAGAKCCDEEEQWAVLQGYLLARRAARGRGAFYGDAPRPAC